MDTERNVTREKRLRRHFISSKLDPAGPRCHSCGSVRYAFESILATRSPAGDHQGLFAFPDPRPYQFVVKWDSFAAKFDRCPGGMRPSRCHNQFVSYKEAG